MIQRRRKAYAIFCIAMLRHFKRRAKGLRSFIDSCDGWCLHRDPGAIEAAEVAVSAGLPTDAFDSAFGQSHENQPGRIV